MTASGGEREQVVGYADAVHSDQLNCASLSVLGVCINKCVRSIIPNVCIALVGDTIEAINDNNVSPDAVC